MKSKNSQVFLGEDADAFCAHTAYSACSPVCTPLMCPNPQTSDAPGALGKCSHMNPITNCSFLIITIFLKRPFAPCSFKLPPNIPPVQPLHNQNTTLLVTVIEEKHPPPRTLKRAPNEDPEEGRAALLSLPCVHRVPLSASSLLRSVCAAWIPASAPAWQIWT